MSDCYWIFVCMLTKTIYCCELNNSSQKKYYFMIQNYSISSILEVIPTIKSGFYYVPSSLYNHEMFLLDLIPQ